MKSKGGRPLRSLSDGVDQWSVTKMKHDMLLLSNSLANARSELEDKWKLCRLKDRFGHIWEIQRIEFSEKFTTLRLGNEGTDNYTAIVIRNNLYEGDTDDLSEWELVT